MNKSICVFCGASGEVNPLYKDIAAQIGELCALEDYTLVYGGGKAGLMGICADAALKAGGQVLGVIPECLQKKEIAHTELSELYITKDMHERQAKMMDLADIFVVLPGGLGTLAEFFEAVTWKQLGLHNKQIFVVNINEYWSSLTAIVENCAEQGFLRQSFEELFQVVYNFEDLRKILTNSP